MLHKKVFLLFLMVSVSGVLWGESDQQSEPKPQIPMHSGYFPPGKIGELAMLITSGVMLLDILNKLDSSLIDKIQERRGELVKIVGVLTGITLGAKLLWECVPIIGEKCGRLCARIFAKQLNKLCNQPDPLSVQQVQMWSDVIKNCMHTVSEQSAAGDVMMRVLRVEGSGENSQNNHWLFYREFIRDTFCHIVDDLEASKQYYEVYRQNNKRWLVTMKNIFSADDKKNIVFMINTIVNNLDHLALVCWNAQIMDDLDRVHIKKMTRTTLLLLQKLQELIGGG